MEANIININPANLWFKFEFDGTLELFKRATLLEYNGLKIAYCEMVDHYCFDKITTKEKNDVYTCEDIAYGNANNEITNVKISIIEMPELTFDQSMRIPYYFGSYTIKTSTASTLVYKDARERLLFTIILK